MKQRLPLLLCCVLLVLTSCHRNKPQDNGTANATDYSAISIPVFCADSAYAYTESQLSFGPRIPGRKGHDECAFYLAHKMQRWCDTVIMQPFSATLWDGKSVRGQNIIASFNPQSEQRILLASHWDSRMWADQDPDSSQHRNPIPGANDGAAGVATLMEMARVMSQQRPGVGIDFIFFDLEDQGAPYWSTNYEDNTWSKGSQYWAQHPHRPYYRANYGILFDMIGTEHPRFTKEEVSRNYAPGLTNKLWRAAAAMGHGNIFVDIETPPILDDHLYVNQIIGIPMIDIVQNNVDRSFFKHWHTMGDNLDAVHPENLKLVANVTMKVIYADFPSKQ